MQEQRAQSMQVIGTTNASGRRATFIQIAKRGSQMVLAFTGRVCPFTINLPNPVNLAGVK